MAEKNQKRTDILASARALFREKGFHNTKMDDIALRAGVGKGTLYEYFKNKQEIFDETCIDCVESIHIKVSEICSQDISFKDKIMLLFRGRKNSKHEDFEKNPIDFIMSYKNIVSEKVLMTMFGHISDMNKIIIEIVNQGKEEGVVRKDIPSEMIACFIVGTTGECFNLKMHEKNNDFSEEDLLFNLLFNGFGVK